MEMESENSFHFILRWEKEYDIRNDGDILMQNGRTSNALREGGNVGAIFLNRQEGTGLVG